MQQGDYNSYYHNQYSQFQNPTSNPNPNPSPPAPVAAAPTDLSRNTYASAPPFTGGYGATDYSNYSQNYPQYGQNSDHGPPSAPSFTPATQPPPPSPPTSLNPNSYSNFNQPPPPTIHPPPVSSYGSFDSTAPYQQSTTQPMYYSPYDQHQTSVYSSAPPHPPPSSAAAPIPNPAPYSSSLYSAPPYSGGTSMPPSYEKPYEKPDQSGYGGYNRSRSDLGSDLYGKRSESGGYPAYEESYGDGVYAYEGGKVEPYGSRGTAPKSSNSTLFDDYGRSISFSSGRESSASSKSAKIVRAVPKADVQEDSTGGVQKFRVKLLAETYGQTTTDVLCQVMFLIHFYFQFELEICLILLRFAKLNII